MMSGRTLIVLLAVGYMFFSVAYIAIYGFDYPRRIFWVGLIGLVVMAVAMFVRSRSGK